MKKVLRRTQFGNPVLRGKARPLAVDQIKSSEIQELIANMRHTLTSEKLGIGLAAPQVGQDLSLAVIAIQPTELRPKIKTFDLVLINPEITQYVGRKKAMWEGCISAGPGKAGLFAKVPRYAEVKVRYDDEAGKPRHRSFKGLRAHVVQHEVDHLNGVLFVDKVTDTKSYMTYAEYLKRVKKKSKTGSKQEA